MSYRGEGEASESRLAALDREIASLERQLSAVFWQRVAPIWGLGAQLDPALSALAARHDRIARLEDTIARVRHGPAAAAELPELKPVREGALASIERALTPLARDLREGLLDVARAHDADAQLVYRGRSAWGVRIRARGAPLDLRLRQERARQQHAYMALYAETAVSPAARLNLEPEGILQDLLEMIGLSKEIELGDARFDPAFVIRGDEETASVFLTRSSRALLLAVGEEATLSVKVEDGIARVHTTAVSPRSIRHIIEVLATWHAAPSPLPLLVETAPS